MSADGVPKMDKFTKFNGQLALTFRGLNKCNKIDALNLEVDAVTLEVTLKKS